MTTTSEGLRKYAPEQRKCFYLSERRLRFFKLYAQSNCEEECLANLTKKLCGCVKFSMPRDNTTKICGVAKIKCYLSVEKKIYERDMDKSSKRFDAKSFHDKCNCLPSCVSIKYDADISHSKFDSEIMKMSNGAPESDLQLSTVRMYFRGRQVETIKRIETTTCTDFMGTCFGLLGLFLGISLLSIIEFIYYSTLRLYWVIRRTRSENIVVPFQPATTNSVSITHSHNLN